MAPEVVNGGKYANSCDVFSFAILCFVVITENFLPYGQLLDSNIIVKVASSPTFRPSINPGQFKNCKSLVSLIKKNWKANPQERNSFKEIIDSLSKEEKKIKEQIVEAVKGKSGSLNPTNNTIQGLKDKIEKLKKKEAKSEKIISQLKKEIKILKKPKIPLKRKPK